MIIIMIIFKMMSLRLAGSKRILSLPPSKHGQTGGGEE